MLPKFKAVLKEDFDYEPENIPNYNWKYLEKGIYLVTGLHFFEGQELTSISIDTEKYGELQDLWLETWPFEVIQFTGLKDVNGTEIYEGDILQYYDSENEKYFKAVVRWSNTYASYFPLGMHTAKVIGNMFENPTLLEE